MEGEYDLNSLPEVPSREHGKPISGCNEVGAPTPYRVSDKSEYDASQWTLLGPDSFVPSGASFGGLPAGFYKAATTPEGRAYAEKQPLISDNLMILPGSSNLSVISGIRQFWRSRQTYQKHGLSYKRGVFFYGPPGSGKTASVTLLCKELIEQHAGAVFICSDPGLLTFLLHKLRKIERERPLIVVMEDLDEIIDRHGEHGILSLLDGEAQIDNVVFLASTNYPDRLGARIVNRPSRFDERIFVDMPSEETRKAYLQMVTAREPLEEYDLEEWTADTKGMSIAHLRELVVAVRCLGRSYEDTIARLKAMATRPTVKEGFRSAQMGIAV